MSTVIVDIDGVVCQYDFPKMLKKHFGVSVDNKLIHSYSIEDCLGLPGDLVSKMWEEEAYNKPNFIPGALQALKKLHSQHLVFIYSNRAKIIGDYALYQWLKENKIPFEDLYSREHAYSRPRYVYHVDDSPQKLMDTGAENKLLFDQPWNRGCKNILGELKRVKSWKEVLEVINGRAS